MSASSKLNGFDLLVPVYDIIAKLVFGKSLRNAQTHFLHAIPPGANVLILGGGTGWILHEIFKHNKSCMVVYVDASQGMIDKARRNSPQNLPVRFIHGTEDNLPGDLVADVIITNCYLDLFSTTSLKRNISILVERLRPGGRWLVTDFVSTPQLYQKVLLKLMYTFFRLTTGIEATTLPQWERGLHEAGLVKEEVSDFYQGFIRSCLYIKPRPA